MCERNSPADIRASEEGWEEVLQELETVVQPTVGQAVTLQPMEVHSGAHTHLQPVEAPCWSRGMPEAGDNL